MRNCWPHLGVFYFFVLSDVKASSNRDVNKITTKQKLKYHKCERAYIESGKTYDELACSWQFEGVRYYLIISHNSVINNSTYFWIFLA